VVLGRKAGRVPKPSAAWLPGRDPLELQAAIEPTSKTPKPAAKHLMRGRRQSDDGMKTAPEEDGT
jgi:hypothetical protein